MLMDTKIDEIPLIPLLLVRPQRPSIYMLAQCKTEPFARLILTHLDVNILLNDITPLDARTLQMAASIPFPHDHLFSPGTAIPRQKRRLPTSSLIRMPSHYR